MSAGTVAATALAEIPPGVERLGRRALAVGVAATALAAVLGFLDPHQFLRSWLLGALYWIGLALGCLSISLLQHLTGGGWALVTRRLLEAGTRTLVLGPLLLLPVALGLESLYHWADPAAVAADPILQQKEIYLNVPYFLARTVFYFAVWIAMAYWLNRWSAQQDRGGDPRLAPRLESLSGPGLVLYGLTVTFFVVDWGMSLEPHWFSTIYGILFMGGQALSAFAFAIVGVALLARERPLDQVVTRAHVHDLGKLMLAFVALWAYFSFSQYLIVWMGNLPEEIPWYIARLAPGWRAISVALILFHFALPFVLLLSRDLKRDARRLGALAALVLVMRLVDLHWVLGPGHAPGPEAHHGLPFHVLDLVAPVGIGGIWVWYYTAQLRRRPLLPLGDPALQELVGHGNR